MIYPGPKPDWTTGMRVWRIYSLHGANSHKGRARTNWVELKVIFGNLPVRPNFLNADLDFPGLKYQTCQWFMLAFLKPWPSLFPLPPTLLPLLRGRQNRKRRIQVSNVHRPTRPYLPRSTDHLLAMHRVWTPNNGYCYVPLSRHSRLIYLTSIGTGTG
jgi:hypothetical protein